MNDPIFFLKLHIAEVVVFFLCLAGSIFIYFNIKKKPESWGIKRPLTFKSYAPVWFPLGVFLITVFFLNRSDGFSYATAIGVYNDAIILEGVTESETESNGITETTLSPQIILLSKRDGKEITQRNVEPMFVSENKLFADGGAYFQIIDLNTGEVLELLSENDIKDQAAARTKEKIHKLTYSGSGFTIQTVKDNHFKYNPINGKADIDNVGASNPFTAIRLSDYESQQPDLFQPQVIAQANGGITLLLSYSDLEKDHFFIHAVDDKGKLLWSKRDSEISPDLKGENFTSSYLDNNTVTDNDNLYFINRSYVVCMALQSGGLQWISEY
ncbi:MAG TPA: hypothetical protein VGK59_13780 [Ohtaekwangia sp.]